MRFSYEGDPEEARSFLGKAQQELARLEDRMSIQGREQGSFQHRLSDTAYCFGYVIPGGIRAVHIVASPAPPEAVEDIKTGLPDFVSGVVIDGYITPKTKTAPALLSKFYPTLTSLKAHPKEFKAGTNTSARLAVKLGPTFDELGPPEGSPLLYSQYTRLKPSMFSGRMRQVVQLLMGFGRLSKESIYDGVKPLFPIVINPPVIDTPHETDVRKEGRRILFDYRYARTHGIVRDSLGMLWLVEIGMTRGIVAMPLPFYPKTKTVEFRQRVAAVKDEDAVRALLDFGGFPTGEAFPGVAATFKAYQRAGRIIQLATESDMRSFYQHNAYSQGVGWCFNDSGTEAHNTCWDFDADGVQVGFHYAINLNITGIAQPARTPAQDALAGSLKSAFAQLRTNKEVVDVFEPAMWKIDRLSLKQLNALAKAITDTTLLAALKALDLMQLPALGSGSAKPTEASRGHIWWPTKYPPQIKYPDYQLGYLLSHDMRADFKYLPAGIACDTTMHVYFVGDELKWCKYYLHPSSATTQVEGDSSFDINYNPIGRFHRTTTYGPFGVPAMFYSNDIDDRRELGSTQVAERYERSDMGWIAVTGGGVGLLSPSGFTNQAGPLVPDFPEGGASENHKLGLQKIKWFQYQAWSATTNIPHLAAAIAVPFYDRCACYYASMKGDNGRSGSYVTSTGYLSSPYIGHYYRDGDPPHLLEMETQVHVIDNPNSAYQAFQDLADEGDWVPHGKPVDGALYGADALARVLAQGSTQFWNEPPTRTLDVQLIGKNVGIRQTYTETRRSSEASLWESAWFIPSPDPDTGITAYIHTIANCYGAGEAVSAMNTLNGSTVNFGAPNLPAMQPAAPATQTNPNFVGVVNG